MSLNKKQLVAVGRAVDLLASTSFENIVPTVAGLMTIDKRAWNGVKPRTREVLIVNFKLNPPNDITQDD